MGWLDRKRALVAGAGSGIGRAVLAAFGAEGARVGALERDEAKAGRLKLPLVEIKKRALLHGHCHQKSFNTMSDVEATLRLVPGLEVETIESSCCGMAGSFGYHTDTIDVSFAMGELSLLPAVRKAPGDAIIVADGTSCRHQIHDGASRDAIHVARVLQMSLQSQHGAAVQ